jgi:ABC-2 type transport system ATP-binding protein
MSNLISASNVSKTFGSFEALHNINFDIPPGQIVGLIGPNGAGKTTLLKAILGLTSYQGKLDVMHLSPRSNRKKLMENMCFIADVAILPKWLSVNEALDFVQGVHPKFSRAKAEEFLSRTNIKMKQRVRELSKGMIVQLHLALVMAIDVNILILDEPTLGLDIIFRKQFYQSLLNDYFNENRTIIITTHQIEEIESILSRIIMINKGNIILDDNMDDVANHFLQISATDAHTQELDAFKPIAKNKRLGETIYIFENVPREMLEKYGELSTPSVSDIFTAKVLGDQT